MFKGVLKIKMMNTDFDVVGLENFFQIVEEIKNFVKATRFFFLSVFHH